MPRSEETRLLVTRAMGGLGDLLMLTPGLHALRLKHPRARIQLALPRRFFPLFQGNGDVELADIHSELDPHGLRPLVQLHRLPRGPHREPHRPQGEAFNVTGERMTIGRSPEAEIFLDDVTVSRNHALLVARRDGLFIDDLGSLNGTYVNRRRIESHRLQNGDELQVGKYKLTYLDER